MLLSNCFGEVRKTLSCFSFTPLHDIFLFNSPNSKTLSYFSLPPDLGCSSTKNSQRPTFTASLPPFSAVVAVVQCCCHRCSNLLLPPVSLLLLLVSLLLLKVARVAAVAYRRRCCSWPLSSLARCCPSLLPQEEYKRKLAEYTDKGVTKAPDEVFLEVVGGRKKGKVYGLGSASSMFYKSGTSLQTKKSTHDASVVSQLS